MAPVFAGGIVLNLVATRELPGLLPLVLAALAIAVAALTPLARRFEQIRLFVPAQRLGLMAALVGLPMLLFGVAISLWVEQSDAVWEQSIGILVILGGIASVILNRRVAPLVLSQSGLWLGVAMVSASRAAPKAPPKSNPFGDLKQLDD